MHLYQEAIIDEAKHPSNFGQLDAADIKLVEYNASCGDKITIEVKLNKSRNKILDLKWCGSGCIISMAASSVLSRQLIGMTLADIKKLDQNKILKLLNLKNISPGRIKCLMLSLNAIQKAI